MFANSFTIKEDSLFTSLIGEFQINSYDIHFDKIIIDGEIKGAEENLLNRSVIMRIAFTETANLLSDKYLYKNLDEVEYFQRIIIKPNFRIEIPYISFLENIKISICLIATSASKNAVNYYPSSISLIGTSDLIVDKQISDKTYLSALFDDKFLLELNYKETQDKEYYLSEVFYNIDKENNFSANVFYNIQNYFKSKIIFNNLTNYPNFNDYFKQNYNLSINAHLEKNNLTLPLISKNIQTTLTQQNNAYDSLAVYANNIDTTKFNDSILKLEFTYDESSIKYINEVIIPFLDILKPIEGINNNYFINLLIYYKIAIETNSNPDLIKRLMELATINSSFVLNKDNIDSINSLISSTKQKYIQAIRDVETKNLTNVKFLIGSGQPLDLKYTNARIDFLRLSSKDSSIPVYSTDNFKTSFSNEITRYFGTTNPTIDNNTLDYNTLEISYSPKVIDLLSKEIYKNDFDFTKYISQNIPEDELQTESYDFAKLFAYFNMDRQIKDYSFTNLLNENLSNNNVVAEEINEIVNEIRYTTKKKDSPFSYISFPVNLRNDSCVDTTNNKTTTEKERMQQEENIPENLFNNLSVNHDFKDSNRYSNNYINLVPTVNIPVQVMYPYTQFKNRENTLFQEKEPVIANSKLFAAFYTNFKLIAKVEYIEQLTDGMFSIWKPLTVSVINNLQQSQKLFCRLTFYHNSEFKIVEQSFDQFSIYNKHFYIEA